MSYPQDPACWSWPVPPLRDVAEEQRLTVELQEMLPPDERVSADVAVSILKDADSIRFLEFHTGVRAATLEGHEAMPRCAMCGSNNPYRITEDHDHRTGLIRGWLCRSCNVAEGRGVRPAIAGYRVRHPAVILGYQRYYDGMHWPWRWWENPEFARRLTGDPEWELIPEAAR